LHDFIKSHAAIRDASMTGIYEAFRIEKNIKAQAPEIHSSAFMTVEFSKFSSFVLFA